MGNRTAGVRLPRQRPATVTTSVPVALTLHSAAQLQSHWAEGPFLVRWAAWPPVLRAQRVPRVGLHPRGGERRWLEPRLEPRRRYYSHGGSNVVCANDAGSGGDFDASSLDGRVHCD